MENNNALITVAMLSVILRGEKTRDYLDIISPFVKSELPKVRGQRIETSKLQSGIREKYGFEDLPVNVINKILDRETKGAQPTIIKKQKEYFVNKVFDDASFLRKYTEMTALVNRVNQKMVDYFHRETNLKKIDAGGAKQLFINFLESYGYTVINSVNELKTLTKRSKENYYIARFILNEADGETETFNEIIEIVKGFFVYKAIYIFGSEQKKTIESNLRGAAFYLDTKLLIYALGYDRKEDKTATLELINLIKKSGGVVKTFSGYKDELYGILTKYARDPFSRPKLICTQFPGHIDI